MATVSPKGAGEIGSVTPEESSLVVYLIDTITGRILHRLSHQGCQGPVHAVSPHANLSHFFLSQIQCNFLSLQIVFRCLVRIGLFTTISIFELTSTRLRSLRSMISLGRYDFIVHTQNIFSVD